MNLNRKMIKLSQLLTVFVLLLGASASARAQTIKADEKAEAILAKAVQKLGGERYVQVKSIVGSGNYSTFREGQSQGTQSFIDIIVFPDRERTEFKTGGTKYIQTNTGETGWLADSSAKVIKEQDKDQLEGFRRGIRTSLDNILRGGWKKDAALSYVGRREASLGKRNNVVRLTYTDGFAVEFEFSDDGFPMKSIYKRMNGEGAELKEEDRYAQFIETQGIFAPLIVDHFQNGVQTSRINYLKIEYNKTIPDAIFNKPTDVKELKKDLKL
jgi:outer membrane lipoprotein-sorting protein